ncbi:MAG: TonB-dependent receptor domain-containing protein [Sphingomonadaceae bacterium]
MGTSIRVLFAVTVVSAHPAYAQRTDNNAVTQSDDAFGRSVGDQSIGIYNVVDVRGFSPIEAGNVRLEGLYIDQQANLPQRLVAGSKIRIGISAQGYAFPAPTGIVDYQLQKPGEKLLTSLAVSYGPWRGAAIEADVQIPIDGERLGIAAGIDLAHEGTSFGAINKSRSTAVVIRYAPQPGIEIMPFWSHTRSDDYEAQPVIFSSGAFLPKRIERNRFFGQQWADYAGTEHNYGVIARANPLGFDVRLGVFRSRYDTETDAFDLLFRTDPSGAVARRVVVVDNAGSGASTSGELRIARTFREGARRHTFIASLRARAQDRIYGGTDVVDLGASRSDAPDPRPQPTTVMGPQTRDRVRQQTYGLAYEGKWLDVGELTVGIQKTRYTKRVTDPDPAVVFPETRDSPVLVSAAAAVYITPKLAVYGGYTRGLEESEVAPPDALNLNEAPPAIRTEQKDAGVRWKVSKTVTAIAGVFDVAKPYYSTDALGRFRQLGVVRNRGIEMSIAGQVAPGLALVAGQQFLDATVSGDEVTSGQIGKRPIGAITRKTIVSINYRLPWVSGLSFDSAFEGAGNRTANAANSLVVPPRAVISLGSRYRFKLSDRPVLLRAQILNVTNTFGWNVGRTGGFTANPSRRFLLSLSADI